MAKYMMIVHCDERDSDEIERAFESFTDDVRESTTFPFLTETWALTWNPAEAIDDKHHVRSTGRSADEYQDETGERYEEVAL